MNNNLEKEILLAQWQTCVEMANSVSQRRDSMNNIFITINIAIIAAISFTREAKSILLTITGIWICVVWIIFIRNFKNLNQEKFRIINDLERSLSSQPFYKEWKLLKKNKYYKNGTFIESILPISFIVLYAFAIIVTLLI